MFIRPLKRVVLMIFDDNNDFFCFLFHKEACIKPSLSLKPSPKGASKYVQITSNRSILWKGKIHGPFGYVIAAFESEIPAIAGILSN